MSRVMPISMHYFSIFPSMHTENIIFYTLNGYHIMTLGFGQYISRYTVVKELICVLRL